MKNFPRKLDSKTTNLRITVPENLDLALEGLIRKVLKEQPKTDDIYSFAADYFETLLKIRDKAGAKYMSSQICPFHNDEDAHEMIKLANSFPKPRTASDEGKDSGKSVPSVKKEPEKVKTGSRVLGDKRKRPVERIKSTTNTRNKAVSGLVKPIAEKIIKPSPQEPKVKEDKLLTGAESNLQDIEEDEEFLKSDPIKELVERELMSQTTQNDINRDKGQSSTDMTEKEKLESEKAVDKDSEVIELQENGNLRDELESKEETNATGDELCGVVDVLSIPRAVKEENETATNQKEENKEEVDKSEKEKTEDGEQAIEIPEPETEEAVKVTNESTPEKPEQVTDEKMKDLEEEKSEDDKIVKKEEDNEKKEIKEDEDKPKESTDTAKDAKEDIKDIKDKLEDETEATKDKTIADAEDNKDQAKEGVEDINDKLKDVKEVKGTSIEIEEADIITNQKEEESASERPKVDIKDKSQEDDEDNKDQPKGLENNKDAPNEKEETDASTNKKEDEAPSEKSKADVKDKSKEHDEDKKDQPKDTEDVKGAPAVKEGTDAVTNEKEEETASEKPKVEVTETKDIIRTTEEAEKDPSEISQENSAPVSDDSKEESPKENVEKPEEKITNQASVPDENSPQEETTKEEISIEEPSISSKDSIEKQEDKEIKNQLITNELLKATEEDNTSIENKFEENDETKIETKEKVEEEVPKTEENSTPEDEGNLATDADVEKPKAMNKTLLDKEDINQNEKLQDVGEKGFKDVVPKGENLKETKEEVIEKEETKLQSQSVIAKEAEEEPAEIKPEAETEIISTEDDKKPDVTEKSISESDQQEVEPERPSIIVSTEEEPSGNITENEIKTGIKIEETQPTEERPESTDQEKTEDQPEAVKLETEQLKNTEVNETGIELKEDDNKESEKPEQSKAVEELEKEFSPGSELKADVETVGGNTVPEVKVEAAQKEAKSDEVKETEKPFTEADTKVDEEGIAVVTPDKDEKDLVKEEKQKTPNDEDASQTEETKQKEETENLKDEENIPSDQDTNKEVKKPAITDNSLENETKEPPEENKPEEINNDKVPDEEKTETVETAVDSELCTVVDVQNLTQPEEANKETITPEEGITIKTITTHYYDQLQVPTTVTKEFKVHRTQDDPLTPHNLSNVGNTIIKSYQLVKELTSGGSDDNNNNNNPQIVPQDINPDIASTNHQTNETETEPDIPKDQIEDLTAIPTSGNLPALNLFTMHELFLDSERKLSSYQKEETKVSSLKNAKESLEDTKIQSETPKTPSVNEDKQEVEEIVTKTVIPRIPEAVPVPPREVEEINEESNTGETGNIKDDKPDTSSSEDSNEPTDSSNNGRSIDSDVPIISVEVRTVIETQILDDDDEANGDNQKGGDYRTELTLTDSSNDVNVEVEATIQVPIETTDPEKADNQNLTDQEKAREQQKAKQQTDKQETPPEETAIKSSKEDTEAGGSSTVRDVSSGESDSTTLTAVTEIKRFDSSRKNFGRSSTQDLLTTQSLDSCKRPPLLKTRSLSVFRQGVTDFEIWNTIEKELEEAATKIQSKYRGYTVRKKLRREDAVQITTEESSMSTTPVEQEPNLDGDNFRSTGEFHDSIVLSIHPR